jgi:hypothetical protein
VTTKHEIKPHNPQPLDAMKGRGLRSS